MSRVVSVGRVLTVLMTVLVLAACSVPEVDLDLPDRTVQQPGGVAADPTTPTTESSSTGTTVSAPGENGADDPATGSPPDPETLDELEQLVSEIEALLDDVSDELDQISFEEEGG